MSRAGGIPVVHGGEDVKRRSSASGLPERGGSARPRREPRVRAGPVNLAGELRAAA